MIHKTTKTILRTLALALTICATCRVWATPTATAVWRSNLGQSYSIGGHTYAVSPNGGTLSDGVITMGDAEQRLGATIDLPAGTRNVSVLVKFSGLALRESPYAGTSLSAIVDTSGNEVGAGKHKSDDGLRAYYVDTGSGRVAYNTTPETATSGYMLFSYAANSGTRLYIGETIATLAGGTCGSVHYSNVDVSKVAIGGPATIKLMDTCPGFVIEEVALFTGSYLQASDVADYVFPTLNIDATATMTMTELNTAVAAFGENTFNYFSASPVVTYDVAPSADTTAYLQSALWSGTVYIKDQNITNFTPDVYGNSGSTLRLSGVYCYFPAKHTCNVPIELVNSATANRGYGLNVYNGFSRNASNGNVIQIAKLKGSGALWSSSSADMVTMQVLDWSEYTGSLQLPNKVVVLGSTLPAFNDGDKKGTIYICANEEATISATNWRADAHVVVNGTLKVDGMSRFTDGTASILVNAGGVIEFTSTTNVNDTDKNFSRITGTGTVRYKGTGWRALPKDNPFATTLALDNQQPDGLLLKNGGATYTIGSLSGDKGFRADDGWGSVARTLCIKQAKDTEWSGTIRADSGSSTGGSRLGTVQVDPGESSSGTLRISGNNTTTVALRVSENASVEVANKWTGATTVSGTLAFSGSGIVAGSVTTSDGSILDFKGSTADTPISGALTLTSGTIIKFPAGATFPYTLATSLSNSSVTSLQADKYMVGTSGGTGPLTLTVVDDEVVAYPAASADFNGESVNWSSLGWFPSYASTPTSMYFAECSISVKESGTITLPSTKVAKLTIDVPEGKTLTLGGTIYADEINFTGAGKVVCLQDSALSGMPECTIKGDEGITIEYPNKKLPLDSVKWIDEDWKGTLVITNCGLQNTLGETGRSKHGSIAFDTYGNRYSKIKAPGFKGHSAADRADAYCSAELVIDEGTTFEFNHGDESLVTTPDAGFRFRKLSGSGTLRLDGTSDTAQYIFEDVASFTGIVEITNPNPDEEVGGKKSFILGAPTDWEIFGSDYPANLVIAGAVTVPGGVFWDTPAGVVILSGGTLTVGAGSSISGIDSKSLGTLAVAAGAQPGTVVELKQYAAGKAEITANLSIPEGAKLKICDTNSTTRLTVPADSSASGTYSNAGMLDLSACTSLTELHLKLGDANSFDFTHIMLPSPVPTIVYDIGSVRDLAGYNLQIDVGAGTNYYYYATETAEEYANGGFAVSNVAAGVAVKMVRRNGTVIDTKVPTDGRPDDYRVYDGGRSFAGAACWHEWDFEQEQDAQKLWDSGRESTNATPVRVDLVTDGGSFDYYTYHGTEDKVCIPANVHPRAEKAMVFGDNWSAAVRCTMPSAAGQIAIAFGDTDNGILGLASGTSSGVVELFNWTNGVYTTLARLQVEHASDAMHIYVFAVTNDTTMSKRYASLYRDGEFIHKAELALSGSITNFMVGSVLVGDIAKANLLSDAANGYVDYVRLYDRILNESEIEGLSLRRPFMSDYETYLRDINGIEYWSQPGEWVSKTNDTLTVATPTAGTHVTVNVEYESTLQVNLTPETAARYGTLIFKGSESVTIAPTADNNGRVSADMVVVRTPTIIRGPGVVDFSTSMVGVDEGASLAFDFSDYPFAPTQEVIKLTGPVIAREYDATVDNRIIATRKPSHTWTVSDPYTFTEDPTSPNYLSYFVTISPTRTIGTEEIYYQGGYLTAGMTGDTGNDTGVFSDIAFESPTILLEGDKVQISSSSALGDSNNAWISDTFNGDIHVTRTTLNLMPGEHNNGILSNRTVTVDSGKTLNLKAQAARTFNFGALTLNGEGTINFADNATATSVAGTARITVADGATLTLETLGFVSGGVTGSGTVKLPAISGGDGFQFNPYNNSGTTIELTSFNNYLKSTDGLDSAAIVSTLKLDGDMRITAVSKWNYTFARITGSGDLTIPDSDAEHTPKSFVISELADYTGSLNNNHSSTTVDIGNVSRTAPVLGGGLLLSTNGTGAVSISTVYVGSDKVYDASDEANSAWLLAYAAGGVYRASAKYEGVNYATFAEAIAAATAGGPGLASIIVLDEAAELPAAYKIITENDEPKIVKRPVALIKNSAVYKYYETILDALMDVFMKPDLGQNYDYIEVLVDGNVEVPISLTQPIMIKNSGGATLVASGINDDSEMYPTPEGDGVYSYSIRNKATTYTWTGLGETDASVWDEVKGEWVPVMVPDPTWTKLINWSFVNSSSVTTAATRYPQAGDTVVFNSDVAITINLDAVTVDGVTLGSGVALTLNSEGGSDRTLTTSSAISLAHGQTITLGAGVTLNPAPTSADPKAKVISVGRTYKVVYGTIFSVY